MNSNLYTVIFLGSLIGSTLCVIPEGEIQIGPIFGNGGRIFGGHKHFEAIFHKGADLKPLIAKKVLLGVGLGAGALAAGGAALIAKKHLSQGWGWGGKDYAQGHYNNYNSYNQGWNSNNYNGGYYQTPSSATTDVKYPASSYPTAASYYGNSNYPSTSYGYPQNEWQGSDNYGGSYGWSR